MPKFEGFNLLSTPDMITALERQLLTILGYSLLENLVEIVSSTLLYATFVVLFSFVLSMIWGSSKSTSTWIMLGATTVSFSLATLYWTVYLSAYALRIEIILVHAILNPISSAWPYDLDGRTFAVDQMVNWTILALIIINDATITWRAWVLCTGHRSLMLGPLALLLGTFATSLAFLGLTANTDGYKAFHPGTKITGDLLNATGALSLATNAVSTLLIAYRLWVFRRSWYTVLESRWSITQKIILMIIESGAFYCALQMTTVSIFKNTGEPDTPFAYFRAVIWAGYIQITAMYPTVVLLLIRRKLSFSDMDCFVSTGPLDMQIRGATHVMPTVGKIPSGYTSSFQDPSSTFP